MTSPVSTLNNVYLLVSPGLTGCWTVSLVSDEAEAVLWLFDNPEDAASCCRNLFPALETVVRDEAFQQLQNCIFMFD